MTNYSEGRSLKPWTKVRDEMIINCEGYVNPIQAAKEGFNAGRTDTLERMKKVREVLEKCVDRYFDLPMDMRFKKDLVESNISLDAREALEILEKELSDG